MLGGEGSLEMVGPETGDFGVRTHSRKDRFEDKEGDGVPKTNRFRLSVCQVSPTNRPPLINDTPTRRERGYSKIRLPHA